MNEHTFSYSPSPDSAEEGQTWKFFEHPEPRRLDFKALIPKEGVRIDNKLALGVFEIRHRNWYASAETLLLMVKHVEELSPRQPPSTKRAEILDEAKSLTTSDRNTQYGEPIDHLSHVAKLLNTYGYRGPGGRELQPHDVPIFQIFVKLSRLDNDAAKMDTWTDIAGYGAIGGEVADIVSKELGND